jgi:cytochrome P450
VSHPEALRAIFTADVGTLQVCNSVLGPLLGPGSVLLLDGSAHLRERKLLMPAFQQKAISMYGQVVERVLARATEGWSAGQEIVAQEALQDLSLDIILEVVFGPPMDALQKDLKAGLVELLNDRRLGLGLLGRPGESGVMPTLGGFWQKFDRVRDRALEIVKLRRALTTHHEQAIVSALFQATDESGNPLSDEHLRDEVLTLLVTGHETTATAMSWGLYWTTRREDVKAALRAELSGRPDVTDPRIQARLPYLDATCKEILRVYPIVPSLFRRVERPFAVGGYELEPGTFLSPSIYLTHHRPDVFDAPEEFRPDRFLDRTYSPYEYLPFGGGVRRCIGMHLAVYEMKVALASLVERFDFSISSRQPTVAPVRRFVTMAPSGGLRLRLDRIRNAGRRTLSA